MNMMLNFGNIGSVEDQMLRFKALLSLIAVMTIAIMLTGTVQAQNVYRIGLNVPITGGGADAGKREVIGAQVAVNEINAKGGIGGAKLEMIVTDTGSNPHDAVNAVRKLAGDDKVLAIVGPHYSGVAESTFPLGNRIGIVQVAVASSKPGVAAANRPFAFRNTLTEDKIAVAVVEAVKKRYNPKRIALIVDIKDAVARAIGTKVFPGVLKKANLNVINAKKPVTFQTGDAQFTAQVTKLKALNPDAIGLGALGPDALNIITEARRQGMKQPFFGTAPLIEGNIPEKGGSAVVGTIAGSIWSTQLNDSRSRAFIKSYKELAKTLHPGKFTANPDYYPVNSYDAVYMIVDAIKAKHIKPGMENLATKRIAIKDHFSDMKSFNGIASDGFNKVGDGKKNVHVFEIKDKAWKLIK
ncbi:MAG: ABC transporter substrate-binding protein [Rhodospirillales bacterium]|nr:ABC transporter substrate-binding protein [Rhodospirillales bacterium]